MITTEEFLETIQRIGREGVAQTISQKPPVVQELEVALKIIQDMGIFQYQSARDAAASALSTGSVCRSDIEGYCKNNKWIAEYFLSGLDPECTPELDEDVLGEYWYTESQSIITEVVKTGMLKEKSLLEHQIQIIEDNLKSFDNA